MDPFDLWQLGAALSLVPVMFELRHYLYPQKRKHGEPRTLDRFDWFLLALMGSVVSCIAWPAVLVSLPYRRITTREERREHKRLLHLHNQRQAFKKLEEAQKCLSQQKRQAYQDLVTEWNAAFREADTKHREEAEALQRRLLIQRDAERRLERIERERMYGGELRQYFGRFCRHGNSLDYPCSLCF